MGVTTYFCTFRLSIVIHQDRPLSLFKILRSSTLAQKTVHYRPEPSTLAQMTSSLAQDRPLSRFRPLQGPITLSSLIDSDMFPEEEIL